MKSLREAHAALDRWYDNGCVGNITFYRAPFAEKVDCVIEQVIKLREMDESTAYAFESLMERLDADKGEFWKDSDGHPDRVKVVKGF